MKIAAAYIRVSTDEQTENSPAAQMRAIRDYAKNNDITLNEDFIFIDEGFSGRTAEKRPAFMRMISMAKLKPKPFEVILVHKSDRFARSREDSVVYKGMLRKECGVQVVSITEPIDGDDKLSIILEAMLEAMAQYYSMNLSEEVLKGMSEKARSGGYLAAPPFGYQKGKDGTPVIIPEEAEVVKLIFEKIHSGEMGVFTLAKYLNTRGILSRKGNQWDTQAIKYIASNLFYTGQMVWNKRGKDLSGKVFKREPEDWIIAPGKHEAIIDKHTFDEVQAIFSKGKKPRERKKHPHWLDKVVVCSECGSTLLHNRKNTGRDYEYYFFQCWKNDTGKCTKSQFVPAKTLESIVIQALKADTQIPAEELDIEKQQTNDTDDCASIALYECIRRKANDRLERANSAYYDRITTKEEFIAARKKVLDEIALIQAEIDKIERQNSDVSVTKRVRDRMNQAAEVLVSEDSTVEEKKAALVGCVDRIIFDRASQKIKLFYHN